MKYIEKNHRHWQLKNELKDLLMECRATMENSTRYAITGIHVGNNILVSTDGRRLIKLQIAHKIPEGNYFCTSDGFLLDFIGKNFPKYEDIVPEKSTLKKIIETSCEGVGANITGLILGELCHAGCIVQLSLYEKPVKILSEVMCGKCKVFVNKTEPESHPFMIEAETSFADFCYIQMPIKIKNEAT